jgi:uncharacterized protein (TIGR03437 family)
MRLVSLAGALCLCVGVVRAQPSVAPGGVLNGASFIKGQAVAPGSIVSIFGSNLSSGLQVADSVPLSTSLGGVTVTFNDVTAPLYFVSSGQINAQVPYEVQPGNVNIVVQNGSNSAPVAFDLAAAAPGVFSIPTGVGNGIIINLDGSLAAPNGSIPGYPTRPAKGGDIVIVLATGLGQTDPPAITGHDSLDVTNGRVTLLRPTVLVGGVAIPPENIQFSGLSPQFPGVYQLNIQLPAKVATGDKVPFQLQMNGITSTDQVTMAISK